MPSASFVIDATSEPVWKLTPAAVISSTIRETMSGSIVRSGISERMTRSVFSAPSKFMIPASSTAM